MAKSLTAKALVSSLRRVLGGPADLKETKPLEQILLLALSFQADLSKASASLSNLQAEYVDWNEVRVTSAFELRKWMKGYGAQQGQAKAELVKEILAAVYNRFNKVSLDFMEVEAATPDEARRRDRFQNWLIDMSKHIVSEVKRVERERKKREKKAAEAKAAPKTTKKAAKKTAKKTTKKAPAKVAKKAAKAPAKKAAKKTTKAAAKKVVKKTAKKAAKKTAKKASKKAAAAKGSTKRRR